MTSLPLNAAATLRHRADSRFKTARLSLFAILPADAETSPLTTLLFGILRRGSERYPRLALLNRRLDELYGTTLTIRNYLHGDAHVVCYTVEMPEQAFLPSRETFSHGESLPGEPLPGEPLPGEPNVLEDVMSLLADMLLCPLRDGDGHLRPQAVEREKQALTDSLRSLKNDTRAYAATRLRELMCQGEPYGLSIGGTVEQVAAITPAEVTAHHRHLLECLRMEVFYTGRSSVAEVEQAWSRAFGDWSPSSVPTFSTSCHLPPITPREMTETMEVSQSKLCMGWSCGASYETLSHDPDTLAAYAVCNELFGGMQGSLLFRHVREELGLCYFCDSALDMTKGILWVSCGIRSDRRREVEEAIRRQLADLQKGRISPEDLELAKLSLQNAYRQMGDSQSAMEIYDFGRLMNRTADTPEEEMERIRRVTAADVARVAQTCTPDTVFFLKGNAEGSIRHGAGKEDCLD